VEGLVYALMLATAALAVPVAAAGGGVHRWTALARPEFFGPALGLTEISLFFLLLAFGVVAATARAFGSAPLDEAVRHSGAIVHRSRRTLLFGVLLALLALLLLLFFTTENIFMFFVAFEGSVLPIFGVVAFFGKRSPKFRAMSYLLYFTLLSAAPLLGVFLYLYTVTGSVLYPEIRALLSQGEAEGQGLSAAGRALAFGALFLPFGVKLACFPLHT